MRMTLRKPYEQSVFAGDVEIMEFSFTVDTLRTQKHLIQQTYTHNCSLWYFAR